MHNLYVFQSAILRDIQTFLYFFPAHAVVLVLLLVLFRFYKILEYFFPSYFKLSQSFKSDLVLFVLFLVPVYKAV